MALPPWMTDAVLRRCAAGDHCGPMGVTVLAAEVLELRQWCLRLGEHLHAAAEVLAVAARRNGADEFRERLAAWLDAVERKDPRKITKTENDNGPSSV